MIIEDIHGNEITEYDLTKGRLEKAEKTDEGGNVTSYVMVYFPFTEEEQLEYDLTHAGQVAGDVSGLSDSSALALAQKLSTATTLSQVRSFSKQVAQEYADKTTTSETE